MLKQQLEAICLDCGDWCNISAGQLKHKCPNCHSGRVVPLERNIVASAELLRWTLGFAELL